MIETVDSAARPPRDPSPSSLAENGYRVELEQFTGPLDLLLHLLREQELEVGQIRVADVCDRYLEHLEDLDRIDIDAAGEFLVMASTLMRIKSRSLLPRDEQVFEEDDLDPRFELVRQLIEYRRFKRVADFLEWRRDEAAQRFPRGARPELREARGAPTSVDVGATSVDDLFAAFARLWKETRASRAYVVTQDDTPMAVHIERLRQLLPPGECAPFRSLFPRGAGRAFVIGVFLALLELMKEGLVAVAQQEAFGDIVVTGRPPPDRDAVDEVPYLPNEHDGLREDEPSAVDEPGAVDESGTEPGEGA